MEQRVDIATLEGMNSSGGALYMPTDGVRVPPPCEDGCPHWRHCARTGDTCPRMDGWLNSGEIRERLARVPAGLDKEGGNG